MAEFLNLPSKEGQDGTNTVLQQIATSLGVTTDALNSAVKLANDAGNRANTERLAMDGKFNALTSQQQQDAEVISARKGETSLLAKINKIDEQSNEIATDVIKNESLVDGKLYVQTSKTDGVSIIDTDITVDGKSILSVYHVGNPLAIGSPYIAANIGYLTTSQYYDGSKIVRKIKYTEVVQHKGGPANASFFTITPFYVKDGIEKDIVAYPGTGVKLRLKISGYQTGYEGYDMQLKLRMVI